MTGKKGFIASIVVVFTVLAVWGWWTKSSRAEEKTIDTDSSVRKADSIYEVKPGPLKVTVESTGRVVPEQELEIKCKASGTVTQIPFDISDKVSVGDKLVQLDPQDEERSLKKAQVSLAVTMARLEKAKNTLEIAEKRLQNERNNARAALKTAEAREAESKARFERLAQLLERKMISQEDYESGVTDRYSAQADLENARTRVSELALEEISLESLRQDVLIAESQVKTDELALTDAERRLNETTVFSPIEGIVAAKNIQPGQIIASATSNVGGGTTVMTLMDVSQLYVIASVNESDIGNIKVDQPVRITVDAFHGVQFRGVVSRIAARGAVNSNIVTFEVKIQIRGRNRSMLKPEMTANVEIVICDKEDAITVPANAIKQNREGSFVSMASDGEKPEKRKVTVGITDGEKIEILSGIKAGDKILITQNSSRWTQTDGDSRTDRRSMRMGMSMMGGRGRH